MEIEIADIVNVSQKTIKRDINKLKENGLLERVGTNRTGYWRVLNYTKNKL